MSNKEYKSRKIQSDDGFIMSPKNDFVFKLLFGDEKNKDLLIELLSVILKMDKEEFEGIELLNTELQREFAEDRKGILDVRARTSDGKEINIDEAIKKATSILEVMSHDEKTRRAYDSREAVLHDEATKLSEAEQKGIEKGIEKGIKEASIKNARNFLLMGLDSKVVANGTGLSIEEVEKLKGTLH